MPRQGIKPAPAQRLHDHLARAPARGPTRSRSDGPQLVRQPDSSLTYEGNGFDATIGTEGQVRFDDKYVELESVTLLPSLFLTFRINLFAWLDKQFGKGDPFRVERRWFLEHTASLREERAQAHWERASEAGLIALRHRLQDIWNDPTLTLLARKRATFHLWDACAEDEIGWMGRHAVEAFVRERCPIDADCAFDVAELRAFNAERESRTPFSPYGSAASNHL